MFINSKFLILLVLFIINLLIIFFVRTRTMRMISFVMSQLVIILFLSISISNYDSFKEIVLALIAYSMMILFLISNYDPTYLAERKVNPYRRKIFFILVIPLFFTIISLSVLFVIKNIPNISTYVGEAKLHQQNKFLDDTSTDPLDSTSDISNILVRESDREKKIKIEQINEMRSKLEINEKKRARLKDELSDNFLFKRYSDVILIIASISTSLLLLANKSVEKNS